MADDDAPDEQLTGGIEEPEMIFDPTARRFVRRAPTETRPLSQWALAPAALGLMSVLFVSGVAAYAFTNVLPGFGCTGGLLRGANVNHALGVAFLGGLAATVAIGFASLVWVSDYLLALVLFLAATTVGVALAFLAADSAEYIQDRRACTLAGLLPPGKGTSTDHLGYLYVLWAVPLVVLLFAAVRALRRPAQANPA